MPTFLENPSSPLLRRFASLLEPVSDERLEAMAHESQALTRRNFGKTIRLFAPLYLSNECINNCAYCGFSRDNAILRVTLEVDAMLKEARHLAKEGFRNILLVAGEHPKFVSNGYLARCVKALAAEIPSVALEVAPMEAAEYAELVQAGAEGLIVYQETYNRDVYAELHTLGPKKDFDARLNCPERAYEGGFRRIGIGALFGLTEWRQEAIALAAHLELLQRKCWKAQWTISLPRMRPCAGEFTPKFFLPDREFVQLVCAMRLCFPHVGIVLSTREPGDLRDALIPLGITMMSAGSHTEPGGYTGQGKETLHLTVRGKHVAPENLALDAGATEQFSIADERSPAEIASLLRAQGFDPVWKDWDPSILATS
ncbi:MAG: biotin and thiamine synthesis associated [Chthoniobacteraceae bacterium]|nr:biotin and thiamine synthesis associated [Chthoniobacteraceae bacterium]